MRPVQSRALRRVLALALAALAVVLIVVEPLPKGGVLISFSHSHGIDVGDLPAIGLFVVAGWLAMSRPGTM
jgi:hypothetical protein